jgi:YVTN family beta-propeller protein
VALLVLLTVLVGVSPAVASLSSSGGPSESSSADDSEFSSADDSEFSPAAAACGTAPSPQVAYAADPATGRVSAIDTATNTVTTTINPAGQLPSAVAIANLP